MKSRSRNRIVSLLMSVPAVCAGYFLITVLFGEADLGFIVAVTLALIVFEEIAGPFNTTEIYVQTESLDSVQERLADLRFEFEGTKGEVMTFFRRGRMYREIASITDTGHGYKVEYPDKYDSAFGEYLA